MASNEGNVAALEVDVNDHDNVEHVTTTTAAPAITTTTTVVPETTVENIPAPSSSIEPVAETSTTPPKDAQVETAVESEPPKDKKDAEELPTSQAATATATATATASAAESTAEDVPAATVIATSTQPTTTSTDGPKTEGPETVNITEEGESSDQTQPAKETAEEAGPELVITLLLTTGARHPFKIDRKYLKRRSVKVENDDPFNMSVYTLKELIWREWRSGMSQTVTPV